MWSASLGKTFHSSFLKLLSKMLTHNGAMKQSIENVTETMVDALTKVGKLNRSWEIARLAVLNINRLVRKSTSRMLR